jgi:dUTP pyrophosphatase
MQNQEDLLKIITGEFERMKKEYGVDVPNLGKEQLESILNLPLEDVEKQFTDLTKKHNLYFQKIHEDAIIPKFAYMSDSGFDLCSVEELEIPPFGRTLVPTGLKVKIPESTEIQIRPKSGLCINQGLTVLNTPGTVDQGYTGEIKVILFNASPNTVTVKKGMKVAQGVLCPVFSGKYVEITETDDIEKTDRGENGFGSTGLNL